MRAFIDRGDDDRFDLGMKERAGIAFAANLFPQLVTMGQGGSRGGAAFPRIDV